MMLLAVLDIDLELKMIEAIRNVGHGLRILKEFFFWVLTKIARYILQRHIVYAKTLLKEFGFTTFITAALSACLCIPIGVIILLYTGTVSTSLFAVAVWLYVAAAYYLFTLVTIAFNAFLTEREELMRQLRDSYNR